MSDKVTGTNGITVTDSAVFPIKNKQEGSKLVAMCKVTLNEVFVVSGIRLVEGKNGLFIGFPQNYDKNTEKGYDICFPLSADLRDEITSAVIRKHKGDDAGEENQDPGPQEQDNFTDGVI